jgi:hypothetical protein
MFFNILGKKSLNNVIMPRPSIHIGKYYLFGPLANNELLKIIRVLISLNIWLHSGGLEKIFGWITKKL